MRYETFRLIVYAVGVPIIVFLIVSIVRRVRAISALDAKLREEEAANTQNPYAQMATMYEAQALLNQARPPKKHDKPDM